MSDIYSSYENDVSRNLNSTTDNQDMFFFSDWFQNGTFVYEEYEADIGRLESKLQGYSDVAFTTFMTSTAINVAVFLISLVMYELLRRFFPNVYASRQDKEAKLIAAREEAKALNEADGIDEKVETNVIIPTLRKRRYRRFGTLPDVAELEAPLEWVGKIFGISWKQVREAVGLDAYFYLRYIRMCLKITSVSAIWAVIILFPVYAFGDNGATGWYHISIANVSMGSDIIWVSILYIYFFTFFVLFVMKQEYKHYVELRLDFLGKGDGLTEPQHQYSVIVENIPKELRGDKMLYNYFDKLFPGKVHSANVVVKVPTLEALSEKKLSITKALEKSIAYHEATGKRASHITGRVRTEIDGIEMIPIDLWFDSDKVVDLESHYCEQGSVNVKKGIRVDSVDYYTRHLKDVNNQMFLLQKQKEEQADDDDKSLRGFDKWFSTLSTYVDQVFHEMHADSKDESDYNHSIDDDLSYEDWSSVYSSSIESDDDGPSIYQSRRMTSPWNHPETKKHLFSSTKNDSSSGRTPTTIRFADEVSMQVKNQKANSDSQLQNKKLMTNIPEMLSFDIEAKTQISTNSLISGSSTTSSSSRSSKKISIFKKSNRFARKESPRSISSDSSSNTLKKESLLDKTDRCEMNSGRSNHIEEKNRHYGGLSYHAEEESRNFSCGSESSRKRLSKLAGRLGLDFGVYLMKFVTRRLQRNRDEEKKDTMSSTGFVTFIDLATVTCVTSAPLTHKPKTLNTAVAPERRDILWGNCGKRADINASREFKANVGIVLGAVLWSIPLAGIQIFANAESLAKIPGLTWIENNPNLQTLIDSYLPIVSLLTLIYVLPYFFEAIAIYYEKRKTLSDVIKSTVLRYFYFQLANIYVSVTAGSIWISATQILNQPYEVLVLLGNSLPAMVGYFITLIVTKMLTGLPIVILRPYALGRYFFQRMLQRKKYMTQRELDNVYCLEPVYYGWEYPSQMLVIVICFTYACLSPIILIVGALYFFAALMVYKKQVLYVYTPFYESGGALFPLVCEKTLIGLICGQLTFCGYSIVRGGHFFQVLSIIPLIPFTLWVMIYFRNHYITPSKQLTLEFAMEIDDKVRERDESRSNSKFFAKITIPQDSFDPKYYRQPVITEPASEPLYYRIDRQDKLTKETRQKLKKNRLHVWEPKRNYVLEKDLSEERIIT